MYIHQELQEEIEIAKSMQARLNHLKIVFKITSKETMNIITSINRRIKDKQLLREKYFEISDELDATYSEQSSPTKEERVFQERLRKSTKTLYLTNFWIGNACTDLFLPFIGVKNKFPKRGFSNWGICVEIDGPLHESSEAKIKKDRYKEKYLNSLGFLVYRVFNRDVSTATLPLISTMPELGYLDSRARKHVWQRIYVMILLAHGTWDEIISVFPPNLANKIRKSLEKR